MNVYQQPVESSENKSVARKFPVFDICVNVGGVSLLLYLSINTIVCRLNIRASTSHSGY